MSFSSAHRTVASFLWLSLFLGGIVVRTPAADPTDASAPVLNLHFEDGLAAEQVVGDAELIAGGPNAKDFVGLPAQRTKPSRSNRLVRTCECRMIARIKLWTLPTAIRLRWKHG